MRRQARSKKTTGACRSARSRAWKNAVAKAGKPKAQTKAARRVAFRKAKKLYAKVRPSRRKGKVCAARRARAAPRRESKRARRAVARTEKRDRHGRFVKKGHARYVHDAELEQLLRDLDDAEGAVRGKGRRSSAALARGPEIRHVPEHARGKAGKR